MSQCIRWQESVVIETNVVLFLTAGFYMGKVCFCLLCFGYLNITDRQEIVFTLIKENSRRLAL